MTTYEMVMLARANEMKAYMDYAQEVFDILRCANRPLTVNEIAVALSTDGKPSRSIVSSLSVLLSRDLLHNHANMKGYYLRSNLRFKDRTFIEVDDDGVPTGVVRVSHRKQNEYYLSKY